MRRNFYKEYIYLLATINKTEEMINSTPSNSIIELMGFKYMKEKLKKELLKYEGPMLDFYDKFDYF